MRKYRAFTLVEILVTVAILAIIAAILFPMFARSRENVHRQTCPSNLKQIGLGYLQYAQDYNEKYPLVKNRLGGWADAIFPYVKSTQLFQCPVDKSAAGKTSDYYFNARLSGVSMSKLPAPAVTIAMGDGSSDQPFDAHLSQLPATWLQDSPATRHLDGANYAFADGHVKWFKPDKITLDRPGAGRPTFLVR